MYYSVRYSPTNLRDVIIETVKKQREEAYALGYAEAKKEPHEFYQTVRQVSYPLLLEPYEIVYSTFTTEAAAQNSVTEMRARFDDDDDPFTKWIIYHWTENSDGLYDVEVLT